MDRGKHHAHSASGWAIAAAIQYHQVGRGLRRNFVPTPSGLAPYSSSRANKTTLAFVPRPKLTEDQEELRKKSAPGKAAVPEWMGDSETQDMDAWELQWNRERLADQGVLLDSSSEEKELEDGYADSLDLCEINTQERDLMADYNARRPQEMAGDTQETAIEID
jgi:hypothetical protein